jgi:GR25 family glycosyltransferase involved in LPS biosynthesis
MVSTRRLRDPLAAFAFSVIFLMILLSFVTLVRNSDYETNRPQQSKSFQPLQYSPNRDKVHRSLMNAPIKIRQTYNRYKDQPLDGTHKSLNIKGSTRLGFDHIYLLNLPRRTDRREAMEKLLAFFDLEVEIVSAVEVKSDEVTLLRTVYKDSIGPGEFAVWWSHLKIWADIVQNSYKTALILEDDLDIDINIEKHINGFKLPENWEMLYLGHCSWEGEGEQPIFDSQSPFKIYHSYIPACTHAYAVTQSGAKHLIELLFSDPNDTIDSRIVKAVQAGKIKSYSVEPPIIIKVRDGATQSDVRPGQGEEIVNQELKESTLKKLGLLHQEVTNIGTI